MSEKHNLCPAGSHKLLKLRDSDGLLTGEIACSVCGMIANQEAAVKHLFGGSRDGT